MKKTFSEYQIRIGDINYGGHMGSDKALLVFHDARINFLKELGHTELSIDKDIAVILVEANVKYKQEVFLHDLLETEVWVSKIDGLKWTISYITKRKKDNTVVFTGTTRMFCYNYHRKKIAKIPKDFLKKYYEFHY